MIIFFFDFYLNAWLWSTPACATSMGYQPIDMTDWCLFNISNRPHC